MSQAPSTSVSTDLLSITYGCVVQQLAEDYGDPDVVSSILHTMGKNMGRRMADEVLAKTQAPICSTYPEYVRTCASVCVTFFSLTIQFHSRSLSRNYFVIPNRLM